MQRELWQTLVDMMTAINPQIAGEYGMIIQDVTLDLPVEIVVHRTEQAFYLMVDLPQWRWENGIHLEPGRMRVRLQEMSDDES